MFVECTQCLRKQKWVSEVADQCHEMDQAIRNFYESCKFNDDVLKFTEMHLPLSPPNQVDTSK